MNQAIADMNLQQRRRRARVAGEAAAELEFDNGALGTITVSDSIAASFSWEMSARETAVFPPTPESCVMTGGSRASLSLPDLRVWSHTGETADWWTPISATSLTCATADPLVQQIAHFGDGIRDGVAPRVSGRDGARTRVVIEAIQASALSGRAARPGTS